MTLVLNTLKVYNINVKREYFMSQNRVEEIGADFLFGLNSQLNEKKIKERKLINIVD